MAQAAYFVAQQIYAGWALFGIVLFGALAANLAHTIVVRRLGRSFGYALASFLLIATNFAIFFVWTFPSRQIKRPTTGPLYLRTECVAYPMGMFTRCQRLRDVRGLGLCGDCGASTAFASEIRGQNAAGNHRTSVSPSQPTNGLRPRP